MGKKVCANNIINIFRQYTEVPTMQLNDVHRLLARYHVEPCGNDKRGPIYDWDDVSMALNSIFWDIKDGRFQFTYPKNPTEHTMFANNYKPKEYDVPEEHMDYCSQQCLDSMNESKKKNMKRKIFITEKQLNNIKEKLNEGKFPVDPNRVLVVKKYLDNNFLKGGISALGEDGYPVNIKIVALKGTDGNPIKNMTDKQLFDMLQDKFFKLYSDRDKRDKLLKQIIKDWYKGKISKEGILTVNFI